MVTLNTRVTVEGISGKEIFDFLVEPSDRAYQQWWPGVHHQLHLLERHEGQVGDVIYMDEHVGQRRLRLAAIVTEAIPGKKLVWQFKRLVRLPASLILEFTDTGRGVEISHTIEAGFTGPGRILDPVVRLFLSRRFADALDEHVRTEFPLLRDRFDQIRAAAGAE